jgi:hypothetical protein
MKYMKKIVGILMLFSAIFTHNLSAQSKFEIVPHTGLMYEFIVPTPADSMTPKMSQIFSGMPDVWSYITFHVGGYGVIAHKNDVVSLGVDAGLNVGLNFRPVPVSYQLQAPVFFMGRLGAGCTPYNEQKFGIGAGVGAISTFWNQKLVIGGSSGNETIKIQEFFVTPSAVAEVNYLRSIFRVHFGLYSFTNHVQALDKYVYGFGTPFGQKTNYKLGNIGFGFIYGF